MLSGKSDGTESARLSSMKGIKLHGIQEFVVNLRIFGCFPTRTLFPAAIPS